MLTRAKIEKWANAQSQLKFFKKQEAALRREICEDLFEGKVGEFTVDRTLGPYDLKAKSKVTRNIDQEVLLNIKDDLSPEERDCLKYKPSLVLRPFKKLPPNSLLHEAIIEKPAMPTLAMDLVKE